MISKECRFSEFVGAVRGKDYFEVIRLADQEATAAERLLLRERKGRSQDSGCDRDYARRIKQLIDYLRFEVRPRGRAVREVELLAASSPERRLRRGI
jgi:hypothetical protein